MESNPPKVAETGVQLDRCRGDRGLNGSARSASDIVDLRGCQELRPLAWRMSNGPVGRGF
eukprot:1427416-Alexandrium_andersonii.AAC.1